MPPAWKEDIASSAVAIGCYINSFFTTNALIDYSVDLWAAGSRSRLDFASTYYVWRGEAPIVSMIFLVLLPMLPFIIFDVTKGAVQSVFGLRQATTMRHTCDITQFLCFAFLLPYIITVMTPAQEALVALTGTCGVKAKAPALDKCESALQAVTTPHLVVLIMNLLLLACDVYKYKGNAGEKAKAA